MRAVDTNVLVFAEIETSDHHRRAIEVLSELAEGSVPWAIPWPCIYEFLRVVTHSRIYHPPVPMKHAMVDLRRILGSPSLLLLAETERHTEILMRVLEASGTTGNLIHDAHIAALCLENGVAELVTGDRDFLRFPDLRVINPFA